MTTAPTIRNGVDVERLTGTITQIHEEPELARFTFRATTTWQGGARTRTTIDSFHGAGRENDSRTRPFVLEGDEPPVLLGENHAPNAVETLLHALTSCLAVGFVYNAAARGIEVRSLDFDIEGDLDLQAFLGLTDERRPGYESIVVRYRVDADAPRQEVEALCEHVQKTSPVLDVIRNPVPVTVRLEDRSPRPASA